MGKLTDKIRLAIAVVLLFLTVVIDFTSGLLSMLSDGVLAAGIIAVFWPMVKKSA